MAIIQLVKNFIEQGGYTAVMIVISGIVMALITLERFAALFLRYSFNSDDVLMNIREQVISRRYSQALQACNQQPDNPQLTVIKAGLMNIDSGREAMKSALAEAVLRVTHQCEARLVFLSLIASAATLLGLLGTISGLIKTFAGLASADAAEKARLLGIGIAEAMYATAAGLIIGLIAMVAHTIFVNKTDQLIGKAQSAGLNVSTWIEQAERLKNHG